MFHLIVKARVSNKQVLQIYKTSSNFFTNFWNDRTDTSHALLEPDDVLDTVEAFHNVHNVHLFAVVVRPWNMIKMQQEAQQK